MASKKPQASPQVAISPGGQVVDQVAHASSQPASRDGHRPAAIQTTSMALASSSYALDDLATTSSSDGPMTRLIAPLAAHLSNSSPKKDKSLSHVERSPTRRRPIEKADPSPATSTSTSSSAAAAAAAADAIGSTVDGMICAAESREASARESSLANGGAPSPDDGGGRAFEAAALHGGPFAASELGRLSLHCTPVATVDVGAGNDNGGVVTKVSKTGAWSSLDGDVLSTLTPMLRSHVTSALGVDLVAEARDVVARSMEADAAAENGGKCDKRPVITVHQVSQTRPIMFVRVVGYLSIDSSPMTSFLP